MYKLWTACLLFVYCVFVHCLLVISFISYSYTCICVLPLWRINVALLTTNPPTTHDIFYVIGFGHLMLLVKVLISILPALHWRSGACLPAAKISEIFLRTSLDAELFPKRRGKSSVWRIQLWNSWVECQSIAHGWFPIRLPLTLSSYVSVFEIFDVKF